MSLSARRAWIEIPMTPFRQEPATVALRKESVDRNSGEEREETVAWKSLSARRAWIEISMNRTRPKQIVSRSPQGERG